MLTSGHRVILQELALYTTFLAGSLSPTAVPMFCELLFGGMLSGHGFVTQALLAINFECTWSSYHHWISSGKWRWKRLACHLVRLVCSRAPEGKPVTLALDDWGLGWNQVFKEEDTMKTALAVVALIQLLKSIRSRC